MGGRFTCPQKASESSKKLLKFPKFGLDKMRVDEYNEEAVRNAAIAQQVERILGKDEVASSNLASSSSKSLTLAR